MSSTALIIALLAAQTPATEEGQNEVRELLRRLVPDEEPKPIASPPAKTQAPAPATQLVATNASALIPADQSSNQTTVVLGFALIAALGFATLVSKKKSIGARPLRRLAAESLGARQHIVLVEALGEYLLVATGGKEPVLLAQLDGAQARARLAAMQAPAAQPPAANVLATIAASFRRTRPSFEDALDEIPVPVPAAPTPDELARAQAALRYSAAAAAPQEEPADPERLLDATLGQLAAARRTQSKSRSQAAPTITGERKADEIRKRLASL